MPPGMLHCVATFEASVCTGGHFYSWETMEHTLHALIRSTLISDQVVNTEEYASDARQMIVRMAGYLHHEMVLNDRTHDGKSFPIAEHGLN